MRSCTSRLVSFSSFYTGEGSKDYGDENDEDYAKLFSYRSLGP
jgi:hypothetical protein